MYISHKIVQTPKWHLLPLSGNSETDVKQKAATLAQYIQQHPQVSLHQFAPLLYQQNSEGTFRQAILAENPATLLANLAKQEVKAVLTSKAPVIFMFPGIGDHYVKMAQGLYETVPYFREILETCDAGLRPYLSTSLITLLYQTEPDTPTTPPQNGLDLAALLGRSKPAEQPTTTPIHQTRIAHPLVFSIEYALAKLLQQLGLQPDGLIGYSLGEYVAATISGVLTLEDALHIVARRAKLIQALPAGKMLAIPLPIDQASTYLTPEISLSAHNGDNLTILAGEPEAIQTLHEQLLAQQIACRLLDTTHAFHSHMMEPAIAELNDLAQTITYSSPKIPYLSNVTGTWITAKQALDPTYWAKHMCQPVQFFDMLHHLLNHDQLYTLIEVGPGQSLGAFVKQHPHCKREQYPLIHPTMPYAYDAQDDYRFLLSTIRKLWLSGLNLNWEKLPTGFGDDIEEAPPLTLVPSPKKAEQPTEQKNRGEKRRQNRLRNQRSSRQAKR